MARYAKKSRNSKISKGLPNPLKEILSKIARTGAQGLITVEKAAQILGIPSREAALLLARLVRRGWLSRAKRGLYLILPLEERSVGGGIASDPWVLASIAFKPCYIGGWSAAEYWGFTEQLFRSTFVATASSPRTKKMNLLNSEFYLARVTPRRLQNSVEIWRGAVKVAVSDREQTLIDGVLNPEWVGGARHLVDILRSYGSSEQKNFPKLLWEAEKIDRGVAFKRLGYLVEKLWPEERALIRTCQDRMSKGFIKLDPTVKSRGIFIRAWGLWDNVLGKEQ